MKRLQGFTLFEVLLSLALISSSIVMLIMQQATNLSQINQTYLRMMTLSFSSPHRDA